MIGWRVFDGNFGLAMIAPLKVVLAVVRVLKGWVHYRRAGQGVPMSHQQLLDELPEHQLAAIFLRVFQKEIWEWMEGRAQMIGFL